jgi:hypothetical protein
MADNLPVSDGLGGTAQISTDELSDGKHAQQIKILQSADNSTARWTIGAGGALVDLGTNNDVTVTSGTVTVGGGTVTVGGTASVSIVGGTAVLSGSMAAGTAYIGSVLVGDATNRATMQALTSGTAVSVAILDTDGSQLAFAAPAIISATLTNGTAAYSIGDTMGTAISFGTATRSSGMTGHVINAICYVTSNMADQDLRLWLLDSAPTPSADNAAFNLTTTDIVKTQGIVSFEDWYDGGTAHVSVGRLSPVGHPLHYNTTGSTTLYGVMESRGTGTYGTATVSVEIHVLKD